MSQSLSCLSINFNIVVIISLRTSQSNQPGPEPGTFIYRFTYLQIVIICRNITKFEEQSFPPKKEIGNLETPLGNIWSLFLKILHPLVRWTEWSCLMWFWLHFRIQNGKKLLMFDVIPAQLCTYLANPTRHSSQRCWCPHRWQILEVIPAENTIGTFYYSLSPSFKKQ